MANTIRQKPDNYDPNVDYYRKSHYDSATGKVVYDDNNQPWDEAAASYQHASNNGRVNPDGSYNYSTDANQSPGATIANGLTLGLAGQAIDLGKKVLDSTQVKAPPPVAGTPAGQQASTFATDLVNAQKGLGAPKYGTAPNIPVGARPTAPGADVYATASQAMVAPPTGRQSDLVTGIQNMSPGLAVRQTGAPVGATPYNVGGTAALQQNGQIRDAQKQVADYQKATAAWDQIYGGTAQQSGASVGSSSVQAPSNGYRASAPQAGTPQLQDGPPQVVADQNYGYYGVNAPSWIQAQQVSAQQIGPQSMEAPKDIATDGPMRDAQLRAMGLYEGAANGTGPSAAEALLRKGIDENVGAQLGMAATLQGNTPGLALRSGLAGSQHAIAGSSADMAALRAQEQERGRAGFLAAASGIRQQDIQIAQSNQTKDLTTAVTNLQAHIEVLKANQSAALQAGMANQSANLNAQISNASNQLEAAKATALNSLNRDIANMTAKLDASKANAANAVSQNIANLNAQVRITEANLQSATAAEQRGLEAQLQDQRVQLEAAKANQQNLLDAAKAQAQIEQFNAQQRQNQQQFTSSAALSAEQSNAANALQQQQINNNLYAGLTGNTINALAVPVGVAQNDINRQYGVQLANANTNSGFLSRFLQGAGTVLGS